MSHIAITRILLGICLIAIFSSLHISVQAQDTPMPEGFLPTHDGIVARSELDAAEAASLQGLATPQAEVLYYKWYAGSTFHPRFSTTGYTYQGTGCIVASTDEAFTSNLQVPDGARLYGVRYYYYDTAAGASSLFTTEYDGLGAFDDLVSADSIGAAGYGSEYVGITPDYTVDNFSRSLALNWYPSVVGNTMRLCGARAFYSLGGTAQQARPPDGSPDTAQVPLAEGYLFITGSSFIPRSSDNAYSYVDGTGCIYSTTGGIFTADIDLPDGYQIFGHRMYYRDTGAESVTTFLTDYDGAGNFNERLIIDSINATGYTSTYANVSAPEYYVDPLNASLAMVANLGASTNTVQFCGVRVYYTSTVANPTAQANVALPRTQPSLNEPSTAVVAQSAPDQAVAATAPTLNSDGLVVSPAARSTTASFADEMVVPSAVNGINYFYRWIAGSNFTPRSSAYTYQYGGAGCTYTTNNDEAITALLHLPDGATIEGVRVYYYDNVATDGTLFLTTYDGAGISDDLLTIDTIGTAGYGDRYLNLPATYVVNNTNLSHVLTWRAGTTGPGMQFCGARVFYSVPSFTVYLPLVVK